MPCLSRWCGAQCDESTVENVGCAAEHVYDVNAGAPPGRSSSTDATKSFTAVLSGNGTDNLKGCLGVTLDCLDGRSAYVGRLWDDGRIATYNCRAGRSVHYVGEDQHLIHPGDYIVAVNDVNGPVKKMVELLLRGGALELKAATAEEFSINLDFGDGSCRSLGLVLKWCTTGWSLLIVDIGPGLVQKWNQAHPEQQVLPNDRIVAVDGYRALEEGLAALESSGLARLLDKLNTSAVLTISRPAVPLCSTEGSGIESIVDLNSTTAPDVVNVGSSRDVRDLIVKDSVSAGTGSTTQGPRSGTTSSTKGTGARPLSKGRTRDYYSRQLQPTRGYFEVGHDSSCSGSTGPAYPRQTTCKDGGLLLELPQTRPTSKSSVLTSSSSCTTTLDEGLIPEIGREVYFCAGRQVFPNGDVLEFAAAGKVTNVMRNRNPPRSKSSILIEVDFQGTTQSVCVPPTQLALSYPKLPGGFNVGDEVIFIGKNTVQVSDTDLLTPGLLGEVVGLAARRRRGHGGGADPGRQQLVSVRFGGHAKNTPLPIGSVRKVSEHASP